MSARMSFLKNLCDLCRMLGGIDARNEQTYLSNAMAAMENSELEHPGIQMVAMNSHSEPFPFQ